MKSKCSSLSPSSVAMASHWRAPRASSLTHHPATPVMQSFTQQYLGTDDYQWHPEIVYKDALLQWERNTAGFHCGL